MKSIVSPAFKQRVTVSALLMASSLFLFTPVESARADSFDPGDNVAGGAVRLPTPTTSLSSTGVRTLNAISSNGARDEDDWFIVSLVAGNRYVFTSDDPRSDGDPKVSMFNAETGESIGTDDDGGDTGLNFRLEVTPMESGDFYLLVEPFSTSDEPFSYVLLYFQAGEGGDPGNGGGGGGLSSGGTLDIAPVDFVSITGVPVEIAPGPQTTITSQEMIGSSDAVAVSGTTVPAIDEETKEEAAIVSVLFRTRENNQPWTDWADANGLEEWNFESQVPEVGFLMFQVRVTDSAGNIRETLGVER